MEALPATDCAHWRSAVNPDGANDCSGALATLVVHSESWAALNPGDAELIDYVVPRQLR